MTTKTETLPHTARVEAMITAQAADDADLDYTSFEQNVIDNAYSAHSYPEMIEHCPLDTHCDTCCPFTTIGLECS